MKVGIELLKELELEASVTRRFLKNVPFDNLEFKPTEKSESLGRLAVHVTEILAWWNSVIQTNRLDFIDFEPREFSTRTDLLTYFDDLLKDAKKALEKVDNTTLKDTWSMTFGDEVLFTLPKGQVLRLFCMNHLIHHRAQLGMYLRLLEIPVPATYGPSADDENVILINPFSQFVK